MPCRTLSRPVALCHANDHANGHAPARANSNAHTHAVPRNAPLRHATLSRAAPRYATLCNSPYHRCAAEAALRIGGFNDELFIGVASPASQSSQASGSPSFTSPGANRSNTISPSATAASRSCTTSVSDPLDQLSDVSSSNVARLAAHGVDSVGQDEYDAALLAKEEAT